MQNNFRKILINFFAFPITLLALIFYIYFVFHPEALPQPALAFLKKAQTSQTKSSFCKKPNKKINPKFNRSINLIKQRLEAAGHNSNFINNLDGCIDIQYSDLNYKIVGDKIEGKFKTTPANSINNFDEDIVKISIDNSYQDKDELLLAFVLIHELTHAKQYFNFKKDWILKNCLNREAESFNMEITLFSALNSDEQKFLLAEIRNAKNSDSNLNSLKKLLDISLKSLTSCQKMNDEEMLKCFERNNLKSIKALLLLNKQYIAQCNI